MQEGLKKCLICGETADCRALENAVCEIQKILAGTSCHSRMVCV